MNRMATATLIGLLTAIIMLVSAPNTATSQSGPPPVAPSWETFPSWLNDAYGPIVSHGCTDWSLAGTTWHYECAAYGETWVYQELYYWDSNYQVAALYRYSFF